MLGYPNVLVLPPLLLRLQLVLLLEVVGLLQLLERHLQLVHDVQIFTVQQGRVNAV